MQPEIFESVEASTFNYERRFSRDRAEAVRERVLKAGLRKFDFKLEWAQAPDHGDQALPILHHPSTESFFIFGGTVHRLGEAVEVGSTEDFESWFRPGTNGEAEYCKQNTWARQLSVVKSWAGRVKKIVQEPDLWAKTLHAKAILPTRIDNEPFTTDEKAKLAGALERIEQRVAEMAHGTDEFQAQVQSDFANLRQGLNHQGRRDWLWMFYGALMGWGMGAVLDGAGMADLFQFATSQLGTSLGQAVGYVQDAIKTTR